MQELKVGCDGLHTLLAFLEASFLPLGLGWGPWAPGYCMAPMWVQAQPWGRDDPRARLYSPPRRGPPEAAPQPVTCPRTWGQSLSL